MPTLPAALSDMDGDYFVYEPATLQDPAETAKSLNDDQLLGLRVLLANEARRRRDEKARVVHNIKAKARLAECAESLSHLFSNIGHAMACRTALRWAAGNKPYEGKGPTQGHPWNPADGSKVHAMFYSDVEQDGFSLYYNPLQPFKSYDEARNVMRHPLLRKAWRNSTPSSEAF